MTKTTDEVEKFIELRARGLSYDKIADEIGTSKPTLLKWSGQYSKEIAQAQFFELNNILTQYGLMRQGRVEVVAEMLGAVLKEMRLRAESGNFSDVKTDKLFELAVALESRLERETESKKLDVSISGRQELDWMLGSWAEVD